MLGDDQVALSISRRLQTTSSSSSSTSLSSFPTAGGGAARSSPSQLNNSSMVPDNTSDAMLVDVDPASSWQQVVGSTVEEGDRERQRKSRKPAHPSFNASAVDGHSNDGSSSSRDGAAGAGRRVRAKIGSESSQHAFATASVVTPQQPSSSTSTSFMKGQGLTASSLLSSSSSSSSSSTTPAPPLRSNATAKAATSSSSSSAGGAAIVSSKASPHSTLPHTSNDNDLSTPATKASDDLKSPTTLIPRQSPLPLNNHQLIPQFQPTIGGILMPAGKTLAPAVTAPLPPRGAGSTPPH